MEEQEYLERFDRQSAYWTGPKLIALTVGVLAVSFAVILTAATYVPIYCK